MLTNDFKSLGKLLSESLGIFLGHFSRFASLSILVFLPAVVLYVFLLADVEVISRGKVLSDAVDFYKRMGLYMVTTFLLSTVYQAGFVRTIQSIETGQDFNLFRLGREIRPLLGPFLWIAALALIRMAGWSFLFFVPGIVFGVFYSFSGMAFLVDGHRGLKALAYSRKIISPQFWRFVINAVVAGIATVPVVFIFSFLVRIFLGDRNSGQSAFVLCVGDAIVNLFNMILSNFVLIFMYLLYREFKKVSGAT